MNQEELEKLAITQFTQVTREAIKKLRRCDYTNDQIFDRLKEAVFELTQEVF